MDKKEQIEKAAYDKFPIELIEDFNEPIYDVNYNERQAFIEGGEFALSQPKEVEPKKEVDLKKLEDGIIAIINDSQILNLRGNIRLLLERFSLQNPAKEVDLDELREEWENSIEDFNESESYVDDIWKFFLPSLQKPVESDAVEFAKLIIDKNIKLKMALPTLFKHFKKTGNIDYIGI